MVQVGQKYRHYKSTGENDHTYEIVNIGIFQGDKAYDMQEVVVYKPLYLLVDINPEVTVFVRPYEEFIGEVEWKGETVKRFTLM